ncbi:hypothetical protein TL16_g10703 [Triparma laevis f. inornata]|uniref:Cyclic nucleotide-binding domain-containing protein n=1 Tax=Triparma laevis f. inornata TaxID=1714386 RepID=A0A9W7BIT1_9STRA|nr:hypothetical protein TL16_g10703 [Triparma laevis f. inornata]
MSVELSGAGLAQPSQSSEVATVVSNAHHYPDPVKKPTKDMSTASTFFGRGSAKSLFGPKNDDQNPKHRTKTLTRSSTAENRRRNSAKLEGLIHQYDLRDTIEDSGQAKLTMNFINSAMSLKDDHRVFHYFLALAAVYAGFVVPWGGAFSDSSFTISLANTVYVTDFLFGVDMYGVGKENYSLWRSASVARSTFSRRKLLVHFTLSVYNFLPFNALLYILGQSMWSPLGNLTMIQVVSRLRVGMKSRSAVSEKSGSLHKFQHVFAKLLKTMVFMMLLLHIFCCSWIMICKLGCEDYFLDLKRVNATNGVTWASDVNEIREVYDGTCWFARDTFADETQVLNIWADSASDVHLYFRTLFLSTTMFVGGENIEPVNTIESVAGFIGVIVGVAFTAIFYGQTMSLIHSLDSRGHDFRKKMEHLGEMMEYLNLPSKLRERINMYYWYSWSKNSNYTSKGTGQFLSELSEPLAMEVQLFCHKDMIGNIPFFKDVDPAVIRCVLDKIIPELFLPGDYIFRQGDAAQKLYMIQSGTVEIVDSQGNHLVTLKEGKYFGEVSLLTDLRRTASAKATSYCTTDTLSKKSFNEIREQFEEFNDSIVEMCETNEYKFNTEDDLDNEDDLDSVNRQNSYTKSGSPPSFSEDRGTDPYSSGVQPNPLQRDNSSSTANASAMKLRTSTITMGPTSSEVQAKMQDAKQFHGSSTRVFSNTSHQSHRPSESDIRRVVAEEVRKEMRAMKEFFKEENEKIAKSIAEASAKQVKGSKSKVAMGLGPSRKQLT